MVPKPGLSQRGLHKSMKIRAIPAPTAASVRLGLCFCLLQFVPFFLSWACRLTLI